MKTLLFILVSFIAITACASGLLLMSNPGGTLFKLSPALLATTPFKNYLVPGIILAVIVGGVNLLAVVYNIQRNARRYNWAMAGGFIMSGWIVVQALLTHTFHWLQFIYLGIGLLVVLMAYQLKGKWAV